MTSKIVEHKTLMSEQRPSREEAEKAVETLLRWIGEDPMREGLRENPCPCCPCL